MKSWFVVCVSVGLLGVAGAQPKFSVNVLDHGAKGDNTTDNTHAFQAALNEAGGWGGGVVEVPAGWYLFKGVLTVPRCVTIEGIYRFSPSHPHGLQTGPATILMPTAGRGTGQYGDGDAFITMGEDGSLRGVVLYYPDQPPHKMPVPYPPAVRMTGPNAAVMDVELLNTFNGIFAVQAHRHYIARIYGQPMNVGIFVDETTDIGRIENVHFNPWYSNDPVYCSWQLYYGRAFVIGRSDWEYVFNTFVYCMSLGYHFIHGKTGACNGNFLGIGADYCVNASIIVEDAQPMGILITNDSTHIITTPSNKGAVRFSNSAFWGAAHQIAKLDGPTTVAFDGCTFFVKPYESDPSLSLSPSMKKRCGDGRPSTHPSQSRQPNCERMSALAGPHVRLSPNVGKAVIMANMFVGDPEIDTNGAPNVEVFGNL